ncbi:hypothetical protein ACFQLX_16360 [Streptomyces polyrhachis]|uniref:Secreted protein n=1 Tax=Streptomyces polyrhachis TaxID=1282885 RepID=A0ABW2GJI5_9ACTN
MNKLRTIAALGVLATGLTLTAASTACAAPADDGFLTTPTDAETLLTSPAGAVALGGGLAAGIVDMQGETLAAAVKQTTAGVPAVLPLLTRPAATA